MISYKRRQHLHVFADFFLHLAVLEERPSMYLFGEGRDVEILRNSARDIPGIRRFKMHAQVLVIHGADEAIATFPQILLADRPSRSCRRFTGKQRLEHLHYFGAEHLRIQRHETAISLVKSSKNFSVPCPVEVLGFVPFLS